ncbi:MAG: hypothetical protein RLZ12_406 [Bacillota bacterium]|jgi:asparagine synthase (glutamine-hydrolysing)
MCGICGMVAFNEPAKLREADLALMNDQHVARGPDVGKLWVDKYVAFGHRRLIVIDPEGGEQPMQRLRGEQAYTIVYNGELYNMEELRAALLARGCQLSSRSDTELILMAYMEWGGDCLAKLNGIFAFAIWDAGREKLFLARDRLGVKPLFYTKQKNIFLFASEIKGLLSHPDVPARITKEGLSELLIMAPARTPGCGVFDGVKELLPGCWLELSREHLTHGQYFRLESYKHEDDWNVTLKKVRDLVQEAITKQLVSDVALGAMLSGGLDSSTIACTISNLFQSAGNKILPTFAIDYVGNKDFFTTNEFQPTADTPWAKKMADHIGSEHRTIYLEQDELEGKLLDAMRARDLPGMADVDASLLLFCREIKKDCTVVLSGECADEVFGGYPWFHRAEMLEAPTFPWARLFGERLPFLNPEVLSGAEALSYLDRCYTEALAEVPRLASDTKEEARLREISYLSLMRWMPILLDRKDRMSMASGLEVRVPFCDHELVQYAFNIPWEMKNYGEREKGLLREALRGILPDEICQRKKSPYPKTHHPQYLARMQLKIKELLKKQSEVPLFQLLDANSVKRFVEQDLTKKHLPWFGQLLNVPALLAHWLQINSWLKEYQVEVS